MSNKWKSSDARLILDDTVVRLIGVPFFGLVIPSATGLIDRAALPVHLILIYYLWFVFTAWMVWEGNRYLLFRYHTTILQSQSLLQKYLTMIGLNLFYTIPAALLLLFGWKWAAGADDLPPRQIYLTVAVIAICVIFVSNMYEKVLLVKRTEQEKLVAEQLQRSKIQAELEALKNQIDPHFMFNALNSLSFLIENDANKARQYTENLAEVYRYILQSKDKDVVLLQDEIDFMNLYVSLLELRYEDAFQVHFGFDPRAQGQTYLIPPVSMMIAVENAVKHNELSKTSRLVLDIDCREDELIISNKMRVRKQGYPSTSTGLRNLDERFDKLLGKSIRSFREGGRFILCMPLLKLNG
ncbi:MAG TPA: histidine kinase [Saprospiraceae bacterium]|nr:histidine kinase [Saprospiraceae bacterium]HNT19209.1 histidine kinase [Saprospiraceae bacterium]